MKGRCVLRCSVEHPSSISRWFLNFVRFETEKVHECVEFIQSLIQHSAALNGVSIEEMRKGVKIMATGGGCAQVPRPFSSVLEVEVRREDEMECLIEGLKFITHIPDEVYYFSDELIYYHSHLSHVEKQKNGPEQLERPSANPPQYGVIFERNTAPQLPCLLVNIGSGVSIIKIDEDGSSNVSVAPAWVAVLCGVAEPVDACKPVSMVCSRFARHR